MFRDYTARNSLPLIIFTCLQCKIHLAAALFNRLVSDEPHLND